MKISKVFCSFAVARALACPLFVEIFPDPTDVPDNEGEFVEIRLDRNEGEAPPDTLVVQFEDKEPLRFLYPAGKRFVLVHDLANCPEGDGVACGELGGVTLPNSRESYWKLWTESTSLWGGVERSCPDSVGLPKPKAGKSFQRVKESDRWELSLPTPGAEDAYYEQQDGLPDDEPGVSVVDSLTGESPLVITEVHHCPLEPEPEWVEVYNRTDKPVALDKFRFCGRGGTWKGVAGPYESMVFTRDTLMLREFIGYKDVRLFQVAMGYLNNTAGNISICFDQQVVDSVSWDKKTVACPSGFNPLSGRGENTPGFQRKQDVGKKLSEPFTYKLSSRVFRVGGNPLRVYVEGDVPVEIRLLDSAGRSVWHAQAPAGSNRWWDVPLRDLPGLGVAYVSLTAGRFENTVGILLRP